MFPQKYSEEVELWDHLPFLRWKVSFSPMLPAVVKWLLSSGQSLDGGPPYKRMENRPLRRTPTRPVTCPRKQPVPTAARSSFLEEPRKDSPGSFPQSRDNVTKSFTLFRTGSAAVSGASLKDRSHESFQTFLDLLKSLECPRFLLAVPTRSCCLA